MEKIGKFFTTLILGLITTIVRGWVLMKVWAWFIVPTFALTPLRMIEALGLSLTIGLLTSEMKMETDEDTSFESLMVKFIYIVIVHLVILFTAWIYSLFM